MENEQKEADTQREAESRDCLSVPSEMGKQLQILTRQHLLQPQLNLPVLPTTGSWDLGCTEGAKAADSTAGSAKRRLVLRAGVWAGGLLLTGHHVPFHSLHQNTVLEGLPHGLLPFCHPSWGLKPSPLPTEGTVRDQGTFVLILVLRHGSYDLGLIHSSFQLLSLRRSQKGLWKCYLVGAS